MGPWPDTGLLPGAAAVAGWISSSRLFSVAGFDTVLAAGCASPCG